VNKEIASRRRKIFSPSLSNLCL